VVASIRIKPTADAKKIFVKISECIVPKSWDTALSEMVIAALVDPWGRPISVMGFACRLLKLDAGFMRVLNQTYGHVTPSADARFLDSFVGNPLESSALLHAMLSSGHIADHDLERLFTRLRQHFLMQVTPSMSDELEDKDVPALYCYLAQQCFINEYVYFETAQELEHLKLKLGQLETAIKRDEKISLSLVIAVACYVPLHSVLAAQSLLQRHWPSDVANVLKQQIQEPLDELALRASIPSLTSTENRVSLEVQRMYEENPYPRWVRLPKETSERTLNARLRELFPSGNFRALVDDRSPQILIAGCGTGQHPIGTAQSVKGADVLAIDLSMASLSYAKRKTAELGIKNIDYAQADLLKLGSLGRTFDVIESSGVLHHLESPFEGWQVLLSLLKPHGLMRLGFYSEIARRDIVKVRNMIAKEGIGSSAQEIRAYRKHLLELKDSDGFGMATTSGDFFSTSACRDLLFHVQEHRMTLLVLSNFFKENDFNFLGFDIDSSVKRSYKSRFPNDPSATDLNNWHVYEEENPDTFRSMYQFWIQKNS
ncbi:methyltransferase domain-containing protein, partial [Burkholderiaceae bacterium]|nr:methyltransferase domain-containing protein [Burkholderiaceae bacterium]